ncbi:MAG: hypothetical protein MK108_07525 [Mariniblastus sp.]|nr:hypothetical protein [Mariniblastus sp.]
MKQIFLLPFIVVLISGLIYQGSELLAQSPEGAVGEEKEPDAVMQRRYRNFKERLSGTKLTGKFTVTSEPGQDLTSETYEILEVEKMEEGDFWRITARIKYGKNDVTVPLAIQVKWAGNTPVMTVDSLFVPGLGTFDARVVFRKNKYAGTWAHGDVGGHLFGTFEKTKPEPSKKE